MSATASEGLPRRWASGTGGGSPSDFVDRAGAGEGHGHVANTKLPMGFAPPGDAGPVAVFFRVDDIERYAAKVVELGGRVLSRATYASGANATCVDDQGMRFELFQPAPGY